MALNTQGAAVYGAVGAAIGGIIGIAASHATAKGKPGKKHMHHYGLWGAALGALAGGTYGAESALTLSQSTTTTTTTTTAPASAAPATTGG